MTGRLSDERFARMSATCEAEQQTLEKRVAELQILMDGAKQKAMNDEYFLSLVRKYTDIQELTGEIIREFVEKIIVVKAEKMDGHRQQRIQIIYNAIGAVEIPNEQGSGIADISTDYAALFSGIKNPYGAPSKLSVSFCFLTCQSFAAMIYYQRNFRRPRPF